MRLKPPNFSSFRWGDVLVLIGLCAIGLVLRVGWVLYIDPQAEGDAADYRRLAQGLAENGVYGDSVFRSLRPPGYPYVISVTYRLGMGTVWGCRLVDISASLLLSILLTAIVFWKAGRRLGYWAFAVFMFSPVIIASAAISKSQGVAAPLLYAALLGAISAGKAENKKIQFAAALASGILLGYASLTRAEIVVAFPLVALYLLREVPRRGVIVACLMLIGGAVAILPWTARNWSYHHQLVPISTNGGVVFFGANYVTDPECGGHFNDENYEYLRELEPNEAERSSLGYKLGIKHIATHPLIIVRSLPYRWIRYAKEFRHLTGAGFMKPVNKPPRFFKKIFRISYSLTALLVLIFARRIWRAFRKDRTVRLLVSLYAVYFALLPMFEVKNINHYPFFWLLVLAFFLSWRTEESSDPMTCPTPKRRSQNEFAYRSK